MNRVDILHLTDEELWRGLKELATRERGLAADAVAYVAEIERRRLVGDRGWTSMFDYCVQSLRWSEATAFRRTRAARVVRKFPLTLEMLYDGRLHIEGLVILYAFLDEKDFPSLLLKAVGKTSKEIEWLVAERRVEPVRRDVMRVVGVKPEVPIPPAMTGPRPLIPDELALDEAPSAPTPSPQAVSSLPRLIRIGFTADEGLQRMVLHAQQLMRHKYPNGSLEGIFRDALRLLIEKKDLGVRAEAAARRRARRAR